MLRRHWLQYSAVLALLFMGTAARADDTTKEPITIGGFVLATYDGASKDAFAHIRVFFEGDLSKKLWAKLVFTPTGPEDLVPFTYGFVKWKAPAHGIDWILVGRQLPVAGRFWYDDRVDQVPTILYSAVYGPLPAIDTGITVAGHEGKFTWYGGGFTGDTVFGNDRSPAIYFRPMYQLSPSVTLAATERFSRAPINGGDIVVTSKALRLTGEALSSLGTTQELVAVEYGWNHRLRPTLQHEWLATGNRWTFAATRSFRRDADIKVGYQTGGGLPSRWIGQIAFRW